MTIRRKYATGISSEFQPGSRHKVLKNRLGITRVREMDDAELAAYMGAERLLLSRFSASHRFTLADLSEIHRVFLGSIYPWAGTYRHVNISKGGFMFAAAHAISAVMREFAATVLYASTPCRGNSLEAIAANIAMVHVEFLLIHPFREGNGRTGRLLATLMAYQAGMPGIDFDFIGSRGREFNAYVAAVQAGLDRNYLPMERIVLRALHRARTLSDGA